MPVLLKTKPPGVGEAVTVGEADGVGETVKVWVLDGVTVNVNVATGELVGVAVEVTVGVLHPVLEDNISTNCKAPALKLAPNV